MLEKYLGKYEMIHVNGYVPHDAKTLPFQLPTVMNLADDDIVNFRVTYFRKNDGSENYPEVNGYITLKVQLRKGHDFMVTFCGQWLLEDHMLQLEKVLILNTPAINKMTADEFKELFNQMYDKNYAMIPGKTTVEDRPMRTQELEGPSQKDTGDTNRDGYIFFDENISQLFWLNNRVDTWSNLD